MVKNKKENNRHWCILAPMSIDIHVGDGIPEQGFNSRGRRSDHDKRAYDSLFTTATQFAEVA